MKQELHDEIARKLIDEGKLIEAGFAGFRLLVIHPDAPAGQVAEMRNAFFAGAQYLLGSILGALEAGEEATENDLRRMDLISAELQGFVEKMKAEKGWRK